MCDFPQQRKQTSGRGRCKRRWQHYEEVALIDFFKENRDFEKPCARIYYTKFMFESGVHTDWRLVRCKARNMRVAYRRAKEHEAKQFESNNINVEDVKREVLKMCWFVDDFDNLFPNPIDSSNTYNDPIFDDEFSKDEAFSNTDNSVSELKTNVTIKRETQDEEASIRQLTIENSKLRQEIRLKEMEFETKQTPFRNRTNPIRKWQRKEEIALIAFLKQNREIEKPTARIYYTKFIIEGGIDIEWHLIRSKVRNMRVAYRKAKELEIREVDSNNCNMGTLRNDILKICWFVDDFDILFPNDMDNSACLRAYKTPDPILDDELSKDDSFININDNSSKNVTTNFLNEEDSTTSSISTRNSTDGDILTVQKNLFNLKRQHEDEYTNLKRQELELAKEKLNFEKEKFRQEIRLKEKEIDSEEKLKVMEIQMKERIAIKKLEIEEMIASRTTDLRPENSLNNIYQNLI